MKNMKSNKLKLLLVLIFLCSFTLIPGCIEESNNINIDYQLFSSDNITIPQYLMENLSQQQIENISQLGESLAFQLEYPLNWKAEYNIGGIFSIIFYSELVPSKSIIIDLFQIYHYNITMKELKLDVHNYHINYTEEEFKLSEDINVWKIIGKYQEFNQEYQNFNQGTAYILYKNREVFHIYTFFSDSSPDNLEIFNHMVNSFNK